MHRVHHQMQRRIEELQRRFGVKILDEFGRVRDVSKQLSPSLCTAEACRNLCYDVRQ
jgi:hypothetical protein